MHPRRALPRAEGDPAAEPIPAGRVVAPALKDSLFFQAHQSSGVPLIERPA
jgi:hypothetical protein